MRYSTLTEISSSRDLMDVFGGYNHNIRINDTEFYDMKNMTSKYYPVLSPRDQRGIYLTATDYSVTKTVTSASELTVEIDNAVFIHKAAFALGNTTFIYSGSAWEVDGAAILLSDYGITVSGEPTANDKIEINVSVNPQRAHSYNGLIAKDALCYVDGTTLYINNYAVLGLTLTDTPKQLISMGAYIIIMPDKKYVNTMDLTDYGNVEAAFTSNSTVTYSMCKADGTEYDSLPTISDTEPANPANLDMWIDTSTNPHTLKQYSASSAVWVQVATTYIKISCAGIGASFKQFDGVKISGIDADIAQLKDLEGQVSPLWDVHHDAEDPESDYIVVAGILDTVTTQATALTVSRTMPNLDFIIESNNRLWGCRYGSDTNGDIVNEIYACKLGDFTNWNCFMGLSTDSYTASCGTDGQFTGAITHLGYPLFFKENCLHKVFGNFPANFQIQTTACRGVQKGAGNSLAIVNETLYYKSRNGVCAYDGSLPTEISACFGDIHYSGADTNNTDKLRNGAVAGSHHNKYYISMRSEADGKWYLFAFDTSVGLWHKEDNFRADAFCSCDGEIYAIDHSDNTIKALLGSGRQEPGEVKWFAETGVIGTSMPDKKYVSRLNIRMSLGIGTRVNFYAQYNSCGEWVHLSTMAGTSLRNFTVPIRPKRCDHFRLRIEGVGEAKVFSISKTIEQGSDT